MAITVGELIAIPDLKTHVLAGAAGLDRAVTWAHVCELADPAAWLGGGELVMTTGLGLPRKAQDQATYVERLAQAGLSGLAIGEQMYAPHLTAQFTAAADRHALPVLMTAYEVPFAAVARAVMDANHGEDHARLVRTLRVYETVRRAAGHVSGAELLGQLALTVGCDLFVLDPGSGRSMLGGPPAAAAIAAALTTAARDRPTRTRAPAVLHLRAGPWPALALAVPASRPAMLVAVGRGEKPLDLSLLRHVATVAALDLERVTAERERRRRLGAELLAALLDSRIDAGAATLLLDERGLADEPRILAACPDTAAHADLHLRLDDRALPHLLVRRSHILIAFVAATEAALAHLRAEIDPAAPLGVSAPLGHPGRTAEAYREARWALQAAQATGAPVARYGDEGDDAALSPLWPRTLGEAGMIVQHVLGPILAHDAAHGARLLLSLAVFLEHNRSWQRAAAALHVHKQTLVYRMQRVEELTARHLDRTQDVAELWFAIQAARKTGLLPDLPAPSSPADPLHGN